MYNVQYLLQGIITEARAVVMNGDSNGIIVVCGTLLELIPELMERCTVCIPLLSHAQDIQK